MTRKNKRNRPSRSTNKTSTGLDVLHQDMKSLLELQRAQENKFIPEVPDVPRIRFNKDRIFNCELGYQYTIATSGTAATIGSITFILSSATGYANYTSCFDQYRIIQANVKFITAAGTQGFLLTVIDYDDATQLAGQASFYNYDTLKVTPFGVVDERTVNPRLATAAYSGSFASYANMSNKTWIDSASPSVQYYGLKYYIPASTANNYMAVVSLMVQFRSQRST